MATKTFEELRKLAIQIRDEKANKQNTALRIGNFLLSSLDKMESMDIADIAEAVLQAETAADEAKRQADIVAQSGDIVEEAIKQGAAAEAAAAAANAAADKATIEGLFKTQQNLSEEEQGQVKRNLGIEDLMASLETQTIEGFSETVNATTSTKSVDNIIPPSIDFAIVDLGSTDGRELPTTPSMSVVLAKVTDDGRVKMQGYLKTSHEEYNIQVVSGSTEKYALNVNIITDIETTYKVFQIRYLSSSDGGKFKGSYGELSQLQAAYPTAGNGSYAFVGNPRHLYEWVTNAWTDRGEFITNVDQAIDAQSERAVSNKAVSAIFIEQEGEMYNNFPIRNKYYDPRNGNETPESTRGYAITGRVYMKGSSKIVIKSAVMNQYISSVVFWDKDGNYISSVVGDEEVSTYNTTINSDDYPDNAAYVGATSYIANSNKILKIIYEPFNDFRRQIDDNTQSIGNINIDLSDIKENAEYIAKLKKTVNEGTDFPNTGFISVGGSTSANENYVYTDYIDISPIDNLYELSCNAIWGNSYGGGIAFYDENKTYISSIYNVAEPSLGNITKYVVKLSDIPKNAKFIRVVGSVNKANSYKVLHVEVLSGKLLDLENRAASNEKDIKEIKTLIPQKTKFMNIVNEEITDGKRVELEYNNIRKNYSICGYVNLTAFEKVRFGKDTSEQGFIVEVDNTNVKVIRSRHGNDQKLYPHGLTISTFLGFEIRNVGGYSQLFLYSDSGMYKWELDIYNPGYDSAFFESVNTIGTLVSLSQINDDYNKDIWIIQDSYGAWVDWGWAYNIYKIGFDTFLIDSKSGAGSLTQLNSLKTHLKYATPKYLVWAMGMNDKDSGDTYNANWKIALDEVVQICKEKGIELVLCTIPNVVKEGYINTYKNRYVRTLAEEQDYTLIDFADAVQLSFESNEWKSGLIQDDDLHPNENGAQVLSIRAVTDFPQLLNGKPISAIPTFVE